MCDLKPSAAFAVILSSSLPKGKGKGRGKKDLYIYMVQESNGKWGFLGGGTEGKMLETSYGGMLREVQEESDFLLDMKNEKYSEIIDISSPSLQKKKKKVVAFVFEDESYRERIYEYEGLTNGETLQTRWFSLNEFKQMHKEKKLRSPVQRRYKKWIEFFSQF